MKKLFILTVLLSANLMAIDTESAHAQLTAAQKEHASHLQKAAESSSRLQHLQAMVTANPTPENVRALTEHITAHNQTVDSCKLCVHGLQRTLNEVNGHHHYVQGDAFKGRVAPKA